MTAADWGKTVVPFLLLYSSTEKSPDHLSRLSRRGNGGVHLAVDVSAPCELRLPLRTGIEEARQIFSHRTCGMCGQMESTAGVRSMGPTGRLVLSMLGYPCDRWRDNSKK
jgi:hypothetical protein